MELLYLLADIRSGFFDALFGCFSFFGEELFVIGIICLLFWCVDKKLAYRIGMSFFASGMTVQAMKITFRIERPWVLDPNFRPVDSALETATGYSFPSGHTQSASAMFSSLALTFRSLPFTVISVVIVVGVALSRMYLGVHTPLDVVTSAVLSVLLSFAVFRLLDKADLNGNKGLPDIAVASVLGIISAAVTVYAFIMLGLHPEAREDILDCVKSGGAGLGFAVGYYLERHYVKFETKAPIAFQCAKLVIGVAFALIIKEGMKLIGPYAAVDFIRYLLLTLWAIAVYPLIFDRAARKFNKA
nr:phosphatase PAP2 family protein [Clostridia bacterium]